VQVTGTHVAEGPQPAVLVANATLGTRPSRASTSSRTWVRTTRRRPRSATSRPGQQINAAICTNDDVDFYKFTATQAGPVSVTVTAGDTPLRATLTGTGVNVIVDVPANSSRTLNANAATVPLAFLVKIEAERHGRRGAALHVHHDIQRNAPAETAFGAQVAPVSSSGSSARKCPRNPP
jgi:hypothetical protein